MHADEASIKQYIVAKMDIFRYNRVDKNGKILIDHCHYRVPSNEALYREKELLIIYKVQIN